MKFQPDTLAGVNTITRHDAGRIVVGPQAYAHGVIVPWLGTVAPWPLQHIDELQATLVEQLAALSPEVVIFGTGARLRFPPTAMLRPLIERRIGFESMDTAAACRTYNVLVTERRAVVAALIVEAATA